MSEATSLFGDELVDHDFVKATAGRQHRAVKSFCESGYAPLLSTPPIYYFQDKATGKEVKMHVKELLALYDQRRKEASAERARQRKVRR